MQTPQEQLLVALETGDLDLAWSTARLLTELVDAQSRALARLEHTARLTDLGRTVAELVHELRQPLAGIKGLAELMEVRAADPEYVRQRSRQVCEQAARMERLMLLVLGYGRPPAEPDELPIADLDAAVRAAAELAGPHVRRTNVELQLELEPDLGPARIDPVAMQQIVVNLVTNAVDAFEGRSGNVRVRTHGAREGLEVLVKDNGPGVPESVRPTLFQPFATTKPNGNGLGLYVSRRLARRFGGELELLDEGLGAAFRVRVPRAQGGAVHGLFLP
jgi:signal transduction histidine kinase